MHRSVTPWQAPGIEPLLGQRHDRAAAIQDRRGEHEAGSVHQRRRRQAHRPLRRRGDASPDVIQVGDRGIAGDVRRHVQVVLPPHDALGPARGAAGVDEDGVVAAAVPRKGRGLRPGGRGVVVADRPRRAAVASASDVQPRLDLRAPAAQLRHRVGELAVEDHRGGVRVVPQVLQLVLAIPVVRVHRDQRGLHRRERRLQVLRRVVEVQRDLVVAHEAGLDQARADARCTAVERAPVERAIAMHLRRLAGDHAGDRLPHLGEVPFPGHRVNRRCAANA